VLLTHIIRAEYAVFVAMVVSLIVVPGPDMLYVVGRSLVRGRLATIYSALGISVGYVLFTGLVAAGLGVVVALNETWFAVVKGAGLVYLTYLAIRLFAATGEGSAEPGARSASRGQDFAFGVLTSALNPKGILFYFAILPQFLVLDSDVALWIQALLLGLTTSALCFVIYAGAGLVAVSGARRWVVGPRGRRRVSRLAGCALLAAIVLVATTRMPVG